MENMSNEDIFRLIKMGAGQSIRNLALNYQREQAALALARKALTSKNFTNMGENSQQLLNTENSNYSEAGDFSQFTSLKVLYAASALTNKFVKPTTMRLETAIDLSKNYSLRKKHQSVSEADETLLEDHELCVVEKHAVDIGQERINFPEPVNVIYQNLVALYRYYQKRFLGLDPLSDKRYRTDGDDPDDDNVSVDVSNIKFSKIGLVCDSPMLTDVLLDIASNLPRYYVRPRRGKDKEKEEKHIDQFEMERMARILVEISNPLIMKYMKDPSLFLDALAKVLGDYHKLVVEIDKEVRGIIELRNQVSNQVVNLKMLEAPIPSVAPMLERLRRINFNSLRPSESDLKPDNATERRFIAARKRLLDHLYETLENIAKETSELRKLEIALAAVEKAVKLKDEMEQTKKTTKSKEMEKNVEKRNEFYVGSSGKLGDFSFVRETAPKVKMKDVYGASFDAVRNHIDDLAKYAQFPRLYTLTSPRGKIKSNLIMIGPYGCGKTEMGRAIGGDQRFIGAEVNVTTALTAWFGEFEKNVDRIWSGASALRAASGMDKLVFLIMDEFDSWFGSTNSHWVDETYRRVQKAIQIKLDGIVDYEGIITVGLTNEPAKIPLAIYRRFKYVDIVGELTKDERSSLLKHFLSNGLPLSRGFRAENWDKWGEALNNATGDVVGKVADDIHYEIMQKIASEHRAEARRFETLIRKKETAKGVKDEEIKREAKKFIAAHLLVTPDMVDNTITAKLKEPIIREQIATAKRVYSEAHDIMKKLHMRKDVATSTRGRPNSQMI